jgi:hypothetical protein
MGLCNFFRSNVRNLYKLTSKETKRKYGEFSPDCLAAFNTLKQALCSKPRKDRPYSIIRDARTANDETTAGMGAILWQSDEQGKQRVISYVSKKLAKHKIN